MNGSENNRLRLAFIGCGGHSSRTLQPNAHLVPEIELVAMCDLDGEKAKAAAERWGVKAWYTDYNRMLADGAPDAVAVVGPPAMMQPIAKEMLGRGLHVFMEKPPAMSSEGALELMEAAENAGVSGMVGTHWRHSPPVAKAQELMAQDRFGQPSHCVGWFYAPGPAGPAGPAWGNLDPLKAFLFQQGVHLVDCTRALMGEIAEVCAAARASASAFDACAVSLRFRNGATGALSMVPRCPYWFGHRIFGTGGGVIETRNNQGLKTAGPPYWTGEARPDYQNHAFQTWAPAENAPGYHGGGYLGELTHFAQSVLSGRRPAASLADGCRALLILEAIYESARSGKPVSLS